MGDIDVLTVTLALAGLVCLYGAITNRNPLDVIKLTLQGKDLSEAGTLAAAPFNPDTTPYGPGAIPRDSLPPEIGKQLGPGEQVLPILPGEQQPTPGGGVVRYRVPYSPGNGGGTFV